MRVEAEPARRLGQHVGADDDAQLASPGRCAARCSSVRSVGSRRRGPPRSRDLDAAQPAHRQLAHRDAVREGRQRLGERVQVGRHDEEPVDVLGRERRRAHASTCPTWGGLKLPPKTATRTPGRLQARAQPCTLSFAVRVDVSTSLRDARPAASYTVATTSSSESSRTIEPPPSQPTGPGVRNQRAPIFLMRGRRSFRR